MLNVMAPMKWAGTNFLSVSSLFVSFMYLKAFFENETLKGLEKLKETRKEKKKTFEFF